MPFSSKDPATTEIYTLSLHDALPISPPDLYDQARQGVVDLIWTVLGYTPGRFPKSEVFELPFMVTKGEPTSVAFRSEEHTSELQSQSNLVCRLLLEKKKQDLRTRHRD